MTNERREDAIEQAYWDMLARRKGEGSWKGRPMSERDAFKAEVRGLLDRTMTAPQEIPEPASDQGGEPTLWHTDLARCALARMGYATSPSREPGADARVDMLAADLAGWIARNPIPGTIGPAYSLDDDPARIRARTAMAIAGALAYGAQGANAPPAGHWLSPFWHQGRCQARELEDSRVSSDVTKTIPGILFSPLGCHCEACNPHGRLMPIRMILCPDCGDKRCPRAADHRQPCHDHGRKPV